MYLPLIINTIILCLMCNMPLLIGMDMRLPPTAPSLLQRNMATQCQKIAELSATITQLYNQNSIQRYPLHTVGPQIVCCSNEGQIAFADAEKNGHLVIVNPNVLIGSKVKTTVFVHKDGPVKTIAFSPDEVLVATLHVNNTVCIWHLYTGTSLTTLRSAEDVHSIAFTENSKNLFIGREKLLVLWERTGQRNIRIIKLPKEITTLCTTKQPNIVLIGTTSHTIEQLNIDDVLAQERPILKLASPIRAIIRSPDGQQLLTTTDSETTIWDVIHNQAFKFYTIIYNKAPLFIKWSKTQNFIALGNQTHIELYNTDTGQHTYTFINKGTTIRAIDFKLQDTKSSPGLIICGNTQPIIWHYDQSFANTTDITLLASQKQKLQEELYRIQNRVEKIRYRATLLANVAKK